MKRSLPASLAAALALGLAACGGGDTTVITSVVSQPTSTTPPTTTVTTTSSTETTTPATTLHTKSFQSASDNIGCIVNAGTVRCDIQKRSWSPPQRPADCPSEVDFGQGIELGSGPARFVCAGDTALNPQAEKLADGVTTTTGSLTCSAANEDITCANTATSHGFSISSAGYKLF